MGIMVRSPQDCVTCTDANSARDQVPPCFSSRQKAMRGNLDYVALVDQSMIGTYCPFLCGEEELRLFALAASDSRWAAQNSVRFTCTQQDKSSLKSIAKKIEDYKLVHVDLSQTADAAANRDYFRYCCDLGSKNAPRMIWYGQAILRSSPRDNRWETFLSEYFQSVAADSYGVPSSWTITSSAGGAGGVPVKVVLSGGKCYGKFYLQQDGNPKELVLTYNGWFGGLGLSVGWGLSGGLKSMPSQPGRVMLGKLASGDLTPQDLQGGFVMMDVSAAAVGSVSTAGIWFGTPSRFPLDFSHHQLFMEILKCKAFATLAGVQVAASGGVGSNYYWGNITVDR